MTGTNWEKIEERYAASKVALDYMSKHPLTHEQAVRQVQELKRKSES